METRKILAFYERLCDGLEDEQLEALLDVGGLRALIDAAKNDSVELDAILNAIAQDDETD